MNKIKNEVYFDHILVTPEIADELLTLSNGNRLFNKEKVLIYADDMANGKWKQGTAETIKISKNNVLLDGHHRLKAVSNSGVSIYFHIGYNLPDEVFDVLDTGKSRNATDTFKIAGVQNSNTIPSIISLHNHINSNKQSFVSGYKYTNKELLLQYNKSPEFWQHVAIQTQSWYNSFSHILPPSIIGGVYAATYAYDLNKAFEFMNMLCTGNTTHNVILLLRNKLITDKTSSVKKMPLNVKVAHIIKSWNYFVLNKNVAILKFDIKKEPFPALINKTKNTINYEQL